MILLLSLKNKVSVIWSVKESDKNFESQNKHNNTRKYPQHNILICPSELYQTIK